MNSLRQALRSYFVEARNCKDDNLKTTPVSRREPTVRSRRRYALHQPTPLTEEEVRQLPVAHQYSS
jgi:hypothetical protein